MHSAARLTSLSLSLALAFAGSAAFAQANPSADGERTLASPPFNAAPPDLLTSGGIRETQRIVDLWQEYGTSMAMHMAGTPISTLAAVHCAAATENFIALEHHFSDTPFWGDLVQGVETAHMRMARPIGGVGGEGGSRGGRGNGANNGIFRVGEEGG